MIDDQERLTDVSDIASRQEQFARDSALVASRKATGPQYSGLCHYCEAPVDAPRRWCNAFCRDFWEMEQ